MASNDRAWSRLRRVELRELAHLIGSESLKLIRTWPSNGDGRLVKAASERIMRRLDSSHVGGLREVVGDFKFILNDLRIVRENAFFRDYIGNTIQRSGRFQGKTLLNCINDLDNTISNFIGSKSTPYDPNISISEITAEDISSIVPDQKFAPARFVISDGLLSIVSEQPHPKSLTKSSLKVVRDELAQSARELALDVSNSNSDRRIIPIINNIATKLESYDNILQLGIASIAFDTIVNEIEEEVHASLYARLRGLGISIKSYLGQFREWEVYCESAYTSDFGASNIVLIQKITKNAADKFEETEGLAAPEIPKLLRLLSEAMKDPNASGKRAVFGAIRTIENISVTLLRGILAYIESAHRGVQKGITYAFATAAFSIVFYIASHMTGVSPYVAKSLDINWIKSLAEKIAPD